MRDTLPSLGPDVMAVSISVDVTDSPDVLRRFAASHGFNWPFAIADRPMLTALSNDFGQDFVIPPTEPMFIIDARGGVHALPLGHKSSGTLTTLVNRVRAG